MSIRPSNPVHPRTGRSSSELALVIAGTTAMRGISRDNTADERGARYGARTTLSLLVACGALLALFVSACSDSQNGGAMLGGRPAGPAADVSEELTGGNGPFMGSPYPFGAPDGYVDHEYVAAGTATAYEPKGELTNDGHWTFAPSTSAAYRTRVIVRRPTDASKASGTVIVEWLNVSGGVDANPEYVSLEEEIVRQGHIWVGVSAQIIGVEGGPVLVTAPGGEGIAGKGLKALDPARYGSLAASGRRLLVRHLHAGGARGARRRRAARRREAEVRARRGRVAVGDRAHDLLRRGAAAHPRVRRLLHSQPRRGEPAAGRARRVRRPRRLARQRRAPDLSRRPRRSGDGPAGRERRHRNPGFGRRPPAGHRPLPALGGRGHRTRGRPPGRSECRSDRLRRADQSRADAPRGQGSLPGPRHLGAHR